jgi:hypothetical protein
MSLSEQSLASLKVLWRSDQLTRHTEHINCSCRECKLENGSKSRRERVLMKQFISEKVVAVPLSPSLESALRHKSRST